MIGGMVETALPLPASLAPAARVSRRGPEARDGAAGRRHGALTAPARALLAFAPRAMKAGESAAMHILFVTATRIGDAVLSTGLLSHLIERHAGARLTVAAGPVAAPLFEAVPGLERLIILRKQRWGLHWPRLYAQVARQSWDLIVDLRGSALAWLLRARQRRVMAKGDANEHRVRQLARLFDLDPPPCPRLWTATRHDRAAEALIAPGGPVE